MRMLKRLFITAITIICTLAAAPTAGAASLYGGATRFDFDGADTSDNIWIGMCTGANLNFGSLSQKSCERQQRSAAQQGMNPYNSPNIGASLCYGASLSFTKRSAAGCAASADPSNMGGQVRQDGVTVFSTAPPAVIQYAALGDSVAAGAGLSSSVNPEDAACGRSSAAYASFVAAARGLAFANVACTGATMGDLISGQRSPSSTANPPVQINSAFATGVPQLITITAGANDVQWDALLLKCLRSTCGTAQDTRAFQTSLVTLRSETQAVLQQISRLSGGAPPKVIITGYYNPVSANCVGIQQGLTNEEVTWISAQLASLNQTLQNAATAASFASFAPLDFSGHDICSANPWVQALNDPSPLHPTATGQRAIAQEILAAAN